jgi:1-aminocyclopropane-1-carboxylate synthase
MNNDLRDDVHMLWAVSKDFGASGLRVGILYSQNEKFIAGLANVNIFSCVSGPMQYLVAELLTDDPFVDSFLDESRRRLLTSYRICTIKLEEMVLPYVHPEAGLFVYVDFSSLLPEKTFEWERKLVDLMFQYARVVLTPGESQRDPKPGMFRICFAWVSPVVLGMAMERLSRLVAKIRRFDWVDLNERSLAGVIDSPKNL